ncbi:MAG: 3-hydroxyisobutyrate dehydrogenase-like beta-hydroxyacid dehydrogenase [Gammaproteobacteria bacterium]|jgi:3-hydroxyisobutyrate dehydrogenase-like beta-hydroxyacid dehydrogenase
MDTHTLGFVGVGQMGLPMARNLIAAGHKLIAFDACGAALDAIVEAGARAAQSPLDVASQADVVFVSLPTPQVVRSVALGENGIVFGTQIKAYVDLSTTGSTVAREVSVGLRERNIEVLDCPVSGGERGAVSGSLTLMMAGSESLCEALQAPLGAIGSKSFYVGAEVGLAQTLKLCNNFLSAANNVAAAEAMVTAVKGGLDANVALDVINASSGRNSATDGKFSELVLTRRFDKSMKTRLLHKDLALFTAEADALGVPTWVGANVKQLLAFSLTQGMGEEASVTMVKHWERWAGVEVRAG